MPKFNTHPKWFDESGTLQSFDDIVRKNIEQCVEAPQHRVTRPRPIYGRRNPRHPDSTLYQRPIYPGAVQAAANAMPKATATKRRMPEPPERLPISWMASAVAKADALPAAQAIRSCRGAQFGKVVRIPISAFRRWIHGRDEAKAVMPMLVRLRGRGLIDFTLVPGAVLVTPRRG